MLVRQVKAHRWGGRAVRNVEAGRQGLWLGGGVAGGKGGA